MTSYIGWSVPPIPSGQRWYSVDFLRPIGQKFNIGYDVAGSGFELVLKAQAQGKTLEKIYDEELPGYIENDDPKNLLDAYNFAKMWINSPYDPMGEPPPPPTPPQPQIVTVAPDTSAYEKLMAQQAQQIEALLSRMAEQNVVQQPPSPVPPASNGTVQPTPMPSSTDVEPPVEDTEKKSLAIPAIIAAIGALMVMKG